MDRKKFWDDLKSYKLEKYEGETLDHLTLIGITKLNEYQIPASYDNITAILFKLFPHKFSLRDFFEYPDARTSFQSIAHCKTLLLLKGGYQKGVFTLTGAGQQIADDLLDRFQSDSKSKSKETKKIRNKDIRMLQAVAETSGFKNFRASNFKEIKKYDVCESLHCTINADEDHLRHNYGLLQYHVNSCKKFEEFSEVSQLVLDYLEYIESNWEELMK